MNHHKVYSPETLRLMNAAFEAYGKSWLDHMRWLNNRCIPGPGETITVRRPARRVIGVAQ